MLASIVRLGLGPPARTLLIAWWAVSSLGGCAPQQDGELANTPTEPPPVVVREPLPELSPGTSSVQLDAALAGWPAGRRFAADEGYGEGWEWSGPDGMRVEARRRDGRVLACSVSRTWGTGAPPVDARRLPEGAVGGTLRDVVASLGPGLLVERAWFEAPGTGHTSVVESYRWAIHDRGVDTGLFLLVVARDGVVAVVSHRWSRS